jgi:hypothetical protein
MLKMVINYLSDWTCKYKQTFLMDGPLVTLDLVIFAGPELLHFLSESARIGAGFGGMALALVRIYYIIKQGRSDKNG